MLNALEKVMYPNGKTKALGDITSGSVSSIIDEVHANTSAITSITAQLSSLVDDVSTNTNAISAINTKLGDLTYDPETDVYNMASGLNVRWHLNAQHYLRAADFDVGVSNAGFRNSIYRGKSLGTSVTLEQWDAIQAGTFEGLFIGDYWEINGHKYIIAGFDYWLNRSDPVNTAHHVVVIPEGSLYTYKMNDTDIVTGGFVGTKLYTEGLASAITQADTDFGNTHVLPVRELYTNAVTDGKASGWNYTDSKAIIMSESMVIGKAIWANTFWEYGIDMNQLPLFALNPALMNIGLNYWLRNVASTSTFTMMSTRGIVSHDYSSAANGVRPCFAIYNPTTQQNNTRKKATAKKKGE